MTCNIKKNDKNNGLDYWCLTHKTKATENNGIAPTLCDCKYKERYENMLEMTPEEIKSLKIIYPNLNESTNVSIFMNGEECKGILKIENSIIDLKDYGGLMLSKLNHIELETSQCPNCTGRHTDNGEFAYTPHSKHLCIYCGRFYKVEKANIGNELALYFSFPDIHLKNEVINIEDCCEVTYDLFTGEVLINNLSCNKVRQKDKEIDVVDFLNQKLKKEY